MGAVAEDREDLAIEGFKGSDGRPCFGMVGRKADSGIIPDQVNRSFGRKEDAGFRPGGDHIPRPDEVACFGGLAVDPDITAQTVYPIRLRPVSHGPGPSGQTEPSECPGSQYPDGVPPSDPFAPYPVHCRSLRHGDPADGRLSESLWYYTAG